MIERRWLPTKYQDEIIPPARATPDAWIMRLADGAYALAAADYAWVDGKPDVEPNELLKEGSIVEFEWHEIYGIWLLTFSRSDAGGLSWKLDSPEPAVSPGGLLLVAEEGDFESATDSLESFVEDCRFYDEPRDGDTKSVVFYAWSLPIPHVFRAGAFVIVQGHEQPS